MLSFHKKIAARRTRENFDGRRKLLLSFMMLAMATLVIRAIYLQVLDKQFLKQQGKNRHVAKVEVAAYRGKILDRNGSPLAISAPVQSVWVNPQEFMQTQFLTNKTNLVEKTTEVNKLKQKKEQAIHTLSKLLDIPESKLRKQVNPKSGRRFIYLKRQVDPQIAAQIKAQKLQGVHLERDFKRFYPAGEVTAHLIGFTNIDDVGQEGLELNYETQLHGFSGSKRVIRDGSRRIIADAVTDTNVEAIVEPIPGQNLHLSIDQRIQYLAYRELKAAVKEHKAHAAALVILDAKTGDVLAAVNQPSFNPNTHKNMRGGRYRNRAITDIFEPGSTVKPFVIACALENGYIKPDFIIDTSPGWYGVGRNLVKDVHNYGIMDLTKVLKKSSNVAVSKIALKMPAEKFWQCYRQLGFGTSAGVGFPGEASGNLLDFQRWHKFEQATLSFGYGLNASVLQLARAYTALADGGLLHSVSLTKREQDFDARRVMSQSTADRVKTMLESVVNKGGTATSAKVTGYRVAGKTGTVKKAGAGGYTKDSYLAVFAGMAPASDPKLVIAIMVDEPRGKHYYGGKVAGPVFSKIMHDALRVLGVAPDHVESMPLLLEQES